MARSVAERSSPAGLLQNARRADVGNLIVNLDVIITNTQTVKSRPAHPRPFTSAARVHVEFNCGGDIHLTEIEPEGFAGFDQFLIH